MDNMDNITSSIGLRIDEVIHSSTDRDDWRAVVAMNGAATDVHGDADRWGEIDKISFLKLAT